jgi:hypothetical protein
MPKALHDKLARRATKMGLKGERKNAYVYGTMNKVEKAKKKAK